MYNEVLLSFLVVVVIVVVSRLYFFYFEIFVGSNINKLSISRKRKLCDVTSQITVDKKMMIHDSWK